MKCSQSFTELIRIANNIISTIRISAQFLDEQEVKHSYFQKLRSTDSQLASKLFLLWQIRDSFLRPFQCQPFHDVTWYPINPIFARSLTVKPD